MLLEATEIHVWQADQADFDLAMLESTCLGWLGASDRQRYQRLVFERHRKQMLLGRYLVRATLSHYANSVTVDDWCFVLNKHGKPALDPNIHDFDLFFNLSHSHGKLVLALAPQPMVGVDIEAATRPRRIRRIAERYFSALEVEDLLQLPAAQQLQRFYQLWTLKEAYIKAVGLGLALPLKLFSFGFHDDGQISVQFDAQLADEPAAWQFWQLQTNTTYQLALALKLEKKPTPMHVRMGQIKGGGFDGMPALSDATILAQTGSALSSTKKQSA